MKRKRMVIGLTGYIASGKGVVADLLKTEFGFAYYSLSERVREIGKTQEKGLTREVLQNIGDELRTKFGGSILAKITAGLMWAEEPERVVIDGIRNPLESQFLAQHSFYTLVAVIAPFELRFKRLCERKRPSDPKTIQEFYVLDQRDRGTGQDLLGQQVERCVGLADYTLNNAGTKEDVKTQIRDFLSLL